MDKYFLIGIVFILLISGLFIINLYKYQIDSFDNLESNLYSYDKCCSEEDIVNCMKYGKTGVCNYNDAKSCICQNAF
jgi:uncharacterized membrane protein